MIIKAFICGGAALAALASSAALAGTPGAYAAGAISAGQFDKAERILKPVSFEDARDPARLINLATVYARMHRSDDARVALLRVQSLPDETVELSAGENFSSHRVAAAMLSRLEERPRYTAR